MNQRKKGFIREKFSPNFREFREIKIPQIP
jgi:hypothetical protein